MAGNSIEQQLNRLLIGAKIEVSPSYTEYYRHRWQHVIDVLALTWNDARAAYLSDGQPVATRYKSLKKYSNPYRWLYYIPEIPTDGIIQLRDISRSVNWGVTHAMQNGMAAYKSANVFLHVENPKAWLRQFDGYKWNSEHGLWMKSVESDNPYRMTAQELEDDE